MESSAATVSSPAEDQPDPTTPGAIPSSPSPSLSPSPTPSRLWRPAAQRNLRNQWSKLLAAKARWLSAASDGRSHATALVNAYLSRKYMPEMDLGVLKDMPDIREKACAKLSHRQELHGDMLVSSYKDMVLAVSELVGASGSLRCFLKASTSSSFLNYSNHPEDTDDTGDGGGIPVFSFLSVLDYENLAQELVRMFVLELNLKRLLLLELLSIYTKARNGQSIGIKWSQELYHGEFNELRMSGMQSQENNEPVPPHPESCLAGVSFTEQSGHTPTHEILQVYLTTWLADVNIDMSRIDEIFTTVEYEMQIKLS